MTEAKRGNVLGMMSIGIDIDSASANKSIAATTRAVKASMSEMKAQMAIVSQTGTKLDQLETKYNATNKVMQAQENELKQLHNKHEQAVKDFGEHSKQATTVATKINTLVSKNREYATHLDKVSAELENYKSKTSEVTREMKMQEEETKSLAKNLRAQGKESEALKVEYNGLSSSMRSRNILIEEEKRKLEQLKSAKNIDANETHQQTLKIRELETANHEAANSQKKLGEVTVESSDNFKVANDKISFFKGALVGGFVTAGIFAVGKAFDVVKNSVGSAIERIDKIDTATKSLTQLTGSAEKAEEIMKSVSSVIKGTPIAMDAMTESTKGLIASGMKADKVEGVLRATTDAAYGLGKGEESIGQISDAFKSLQASGTASLGDLARLTDANVPAIKILANQYGMSVEDMKKKITSGALKSEEVIDKLVKGMENGTKGSNGATIALSGQAKTAGDSISGSFANMKSAINRSIANIITPFKGTLIKGMTDGGATIEKVFGGMGANVQKSFDVISSVSGKIKTIFGDGLEGGKVDVLGQYFKPDTVAAIIVTIDNIKVKFGEFKAALSTGTGNIFGKFKESFEVMKTVIMSAMPAIKSTITGAITTFKAVFNTLKPFIMPIITQIADIFKGIFTTLKTFWAENGPMIIAAITNVIKGIQTAIQFILPIIKPVLAIVFSIISGLISNIKGVIQGGLNVIMGVIKIFAGLFTGNFSKMWEGIKQVFAGAIKFVWNAVNLLFVGRIFKGIKVLATGAKTAISGMWAGIKGFFTNGVSAVWNIYKSMPTRILNGFKTLGTGAKNVVSNMWNGIKGFFTNGASAVWNGMKSLPSKVINLFKNMKDGVFGWVKKMIDNVKDMPHRMAEGIKNGASALKNKFKSMFVGVVNVISKPVNGILGGINWVLDKVGATELPTWKVPAYAKGTESHAGGLAMINDGKGKHYKEAVQNPDGSTFIAQGRNVVMPLQKGAKVLNGNDTNMWMQSINIPHYENGIGNWFGNAWDSTKNVASKAWGATKAFAGDIWDYAKNPMKIVKDVVNSTLKPILGTMSKAPLSIAKGAVNTTFGSMGEWIKGIFEENGGTSGNVAGGAKAWIPNIKKAAKRMNVDLTSGGLQAILRRITQESNGSASIVNNWDSNAKAGMPSKGLLQYIQPTLNSWVPKGVKPDLGNGYTQLLAMFNDSNWLRDISVPGGWGPTGIKKYANGGFIKKHQIAEIGEEGEEVIIPMGLNRRERAIQLLHKTMDRLGVSRNNAKDSNHKSRNTEGNVTNVTVENTEVVKLLIKQNELLMQIANQDKNTYLDGKVITDKVSNTQANKYNELNYSGGVM